MKTKLTAVAIAGLLGAIALLANVGLLRLAAVVGSGRTIRP